MRKLLSFALVVVVSIAFPVALAAKDLTKIRVVVTNVNGKPVDRANVIVRFGGRKVAKLGRKVMTQWEMRSTQEGIADIPEMPKGSIRVMVTAKGYQTFGDTFEVTEDDRTIEVKLNPPQGQYSAHEN
jgi:Carboxypeptidase regulatory-like domain